MDDYDLNRQTRAIVCPGAQAWIFFLLGGRYYEQPQHMQKISCVEGKVGTLHCGEDESRIWELQKWLFHALTGGAGDRMPGPLELISDRADDETPLGRFFVAHSFL